MKKILGMLGMLAVALVLVLGLLPAQEAKADTVFQATVGVPYSLQLTFNYREFLGYGVSSNGITINLSQDRNTGTDTLTLSGTPINVTDRPILIAKEQKLDSGDMINYYLTVVCPGHTGGTATCTKKAICEVCGQEYGETNSNNHDWNIWTDTEDGANHTHVCLRGCGATETVPHTYSWTYIDDDTCKGVCECGAQTTEAHYDRWASFCGRQPHCEKCDHDYGVIPEHEMWYEDRGESGHMPNCYHCDTYFFIEPHTYGDWQDNGDGTHSRSCVCGSTQTVKHTYGDWQDNRDGMHSHSCICGATETVAHNWGDWKFASDTTHSRRCQDCGAYEREGHTRDENCYCSVCGGYGHVTTVFQDGVHKAATCTEPGFEIDGKCWLCEYCGKYYNPVYHDQPSTPITGTVTPVLGHDWATEWTIDGDVHYHACSRCDARKDEASHSFGDDWKDNGDGTHSRGCVCGSTQTVGHVGGTDTCTEGAKCSFCGVKYGKPLGHDLIDHEAQAPACTEIGWDAYQTCSRCDYTTYAEKKALGHTEVIDPAVPATYTSTGLTEGKHCSVCNQVLVAQEVVPRLVAPAPVEWAHVHTPVKDAAVAATCTRSGLTAGSHCSMCGEVLTKQRRTSALGHDFGAWTPAMAGTHSAICRRCGESSAVGCALVELDGARVCPVCGYAEGEARTTVIAPASATGDVPGGSLVIVKAETEKGKWLLMGFERGGRLLDIRGQIRFSVPAEALAGAALPGMEISGGQARFALNMEQQTEVILVEMGQ